MARRTKVEVETALDAALAVKHIWNVDFVSLKDSLTSLIDTARKSAQDVYLAVEDHSDDEIMRELYYAYPHPATFGSMIKKVAKATKKGVPVKYEAALKAYQDYVAEYGPVCQKIVDVKEFIEKGRKPIQTKEITFEERKALHEEKEALRIKITYGRATYGEKSMARSRIREINATLKASDAMRFGTSPVFHAILPLKEAAMQYARERATVHVEKAKEKMAKDGWNLDVTAPRPNAEDRKNKIIAQGMNEYRMMFFSLVTLDQEKIVAEGYGPTRLTYGRNKEDAPAYVVWSQERADKEIERAGIQAGMDFDAFASKMDNKVGEHDTAKIEGKPWIGCTVTITKAEVVEVWETQQIINYSVYGKAYNQWPTRLKG